MALPISDRALSMMKEAGYPILEEVEFEVDSQLPIMGYTTQRKGKMVIVVSGWSLKTDMSMGLVIHELSHVYRTETFHPSHNYSIQEKAVQKVTTDKKLNHEQKEIMFNVINNIQDLYADDISFEVYIKKHLRNHINEFFLGWIHEPTNDSWENAENLINAAFAKANLDRHGANDNEQIIEKAVNGYLKKIDKNQAGKYDYFKNIMTFLPEKISEEDFRQLLVKFMGEFVNLAAPNS
jgi:hypothetical protein